MEPYPVPVVEVYDLQAVAAGSYHSLGLRSDGTVWGWGGWSYGANGAAVALLRPIRIDISDVTAIAAGGYSSVALKADGSVWAWGRNTSGELGNGATDSGTHMTPAKVDLAGIFTAVATNGGHSLALRSDGTVWAWGANTYGQIGTGSTRTTTVTTPVQVKNLTSVRAIAAGNTHSLAVRTDGTTWSWGRNQDGALGDGTTVDRATPVLVAGLVGALQLGGGWNNSIALDDTGRVWTWGYGGHGEAGRPGAQPGHPPSSSTTPVVVPSLANVKLIAKTASSTFAVKTDGTTWSWGLNNLGQLGVGDLSYCIYPNYGQPIRCKNVPTLVPGMVNPRSVAVGEAAMVASNGGSIQPPMALAGTALTRSLPELLGFRPGQGTVADPVDTASGNFVHVEHDLDAENGAFGLEWNRTYNSRSSATGALGRGWTTSFSERIALDGNGNAVLTKSDGRSATFTTAGFGSFTRPADEFAELAQLADGTWHLSSFDGRVTAFDASGRLLRKSNWAGETATATYDTSGLLVRIEASSGASLALTYQAGRLVEVATDDGRRATYTYLAGELTGATSRERGTTTYAFDQSGRVSSVTDATGAKVVSNTYDAAGRVATQSTGTAGSLMSFVYEDAAGLTRVTDEATGQSITYTHDAAGRIRAVFDPAGGVGANSYDSATGYLTSTKNRLGGVDQHTYDAHGNVTTTKGANGITRTAGYDSQDRLVVFGDPAHGTTTFTYDGSNRAPTTVTDAAGKVTTFEIVGGLVHRKVDADGVVTAFGYDTSRRLASKTLAPGTPLAATTAYTYDLAGRLLTVTDPLQKTTTYTYDGAGRMLSTRDPLGHVTSYAYDAAGRLLTTTDPTGKVTTNAYDSSGRLATTTSPRGLVTTFGYDSLGQATSTTFPGGVTDTATTFGPLGRPASTVDERNASTSYGYDADGNVTTSTGPVGDVTSTTYDSAGRVKTTTDALGRPSSTTLYDNKGRVGWTTALGELTTSYTYDPLGRTWKETDPRGGVTETLYTDAGRIRSVTTPDGVTTTNTYDASGRLWKETTPLGDTVHEYDLAGRETRTTSPGGLVTTNDYDAAGRLTQVTDPAGVVTSYTYTARDERAGETRTGQGTVSYTYDPDGNLASVTDALGHTTTFGYDDRNRRTTQTDATGKTTTWAFDEAGHVTSRTDPLGRATTFTYDAAGRLLKATDPTARSTTRNYDAGGQLVGLTYDDGVTTSFTYDSAGRRASAVDPTGTTSYTYEPGGLLTSLTRPDGRKLSYAYDTAGRRTKATLPDGSSYAYVYDASSRLSSITPTETLGDSFTAANTAGPDDAKWTRTVAAGATATVQGNALTLTTPNTAGAVVTVSATTPPSVDAEVAMRYKFADIAGGATLQAHLRAAADSYWVELANDTGVVKLQKKQGATTTTLGSFASTADTTWHGLRFRVEGSSLKVRVWDASQPEPAAWNVEVVDSSITAGGTAKVAFTRVKGGHSASIDDVVYNDLSNPPTPVLRYSYDADGNVTSEGLPDGTRSLAYTDGRLTRLEQILPNASTVTSLAYDASGRLGSETVGAATTSYTYDAGGQLTGVVPPSGSNTTYSYDAVGRRVTSAAGGVATTYGYDDAGRLVTSTTGTSTTSYSYDAAGRRVGEANGAATTSYAYDRAGRLSTYTRAGTTQARSYDADGLLIGVANTSGAGTTKSSLDWDVATSLPVLLAVAGSGTTTLVGDGSPAAMRRGSTATGLAVDGRGSVVSTPATANLARASSYDAFGVASGSSTFDPRLGYRGELVLDGLVHLRAREYSPSGAAFTTVDPLEGVPGTSTIANRYHYADNDPVNQTDPTGMQPGISGFVGLDDSLRPGGGAFGLFVSPGAVPPPLAGAGAAGAGAATLGGAAAGVAIVGGVAVFGSTTGIDLPDLPGRLPDLPKLCELWCDNLESAKEEADEATRNMLDGWNRRLQTTRQKNPEDLVPIFRAMNRDYRKGDGSWKRWSQQQYTRQIEFDGRGVSFVEGPGIFIEPGFRKKRAMFPVFVIVHGGSRAKQPGRPYSIVGPDCTARDTPKPNNSFHWDVDCGDPEQTVKVLGEYGHWLWNPPLPNPAYSG